MSQSVSSGGEFIMSNGSENLSHGFLLYVDDMLVLCLETDFLIHLNLKRNLFKKIHQTN